MLKNTIFSKNIWIIITILLSVFLLVWVLRFVGLYEGFNGNGLTEFSVPMIGGEDAAAPKVYAF